MVMDVSGRNPTSEAGKDFQATIWEWFALLDLLSTLCADVLDADLLLAMRRNNGAGPAHQATCTEIALRLNNWMEQHVDGHAVDLGVRIRRTDRTVLTSQEEAEVPEYETEPGHAISDGELKKWLSFLRHCGGFAVW